jgi:hypothetical protein
MPTGSNPKDFSEDFFQYLPPTDDRVRHGMTRGMIVFDTNVLLNLYRFGPNARSELFSAFERVGDRVWLPHQVGLEFHRTRPEVIFGYDAVYRSALDAVDSHQKTVRSDLREKITHLAKRTALTEDDEQSLLESIDETFVPLKQRLERLRDSHGIDGSLSNDPILQRLSLTGRQDWQRIQKGRARSRTRRGQPTNKGKDSAGLHG